MSDSYHNELVNLGYAQGYRDGERKGRTDAIDDYMNALLNVLDDFGSLSNATVRQIAERLKEQTNE